MRDCRNIWRRMDNVGRSIFLSGMVSALFFLVMGKAFVAVGLLLLTMLSCTRYTIGRSQRMLLAYGTLYYAMPDGEVVELPLTEVLREPKRYADRCFTLYCPYDGKDLDGNWLTPFGLAIDVSACETLPPLRRGEMLRVCGSVQISGGLALLKAHSCVMG